MEPFNDSPAFMHSSKNYQFTDEMVIRNADAGKVMGKGGKRIQMIESLSKTSISMKKGSPADRDRLVRISGQAIENVNQAKQLIQETIFRNASPIRGSESGSAFNKPRRTLEPDDSGHQGYYKGTDHASAVTEMFHQMMSACHMDTEDREHNYLQRKNCNSVNFRPEKEFRTNENYTFQDGRHSTSRDQYTKNKSRDLSPYNSQSQRQWKANEDRFANHQQFRQHSPPRVNIENKYRDQSPHKQNQRQYQAPEQTYANDRKFRWLSPPRDQNKEKGYNNQSPHSQNQNKYKTTENNFEKSKNTRKNKKRKPINSPANAASPINKSITSRILTEAITSYPECSASLLSLFENHGIAPTSVREIVSANSSSFQLSGEIVKVVLNIQLCAAHQTPGGCSNKTGCQDLHICPGAVTGACSDDVCVLGHAWKTNHNNKVLCNHHIEHLSVTVLQRLMKSILNGTTEMQKVDICKDYNGSGCNQTDCQSLHLCQRIVANGKCSNASCNLNHNILSTDCEKILKSHGIDTNESPRDILTQMIDSNPLLNKAVTKHNESTDRNKTNVKDSNKSDISQGKNQSTTATEIKSVSTIKSKTPKRTLWTHHFQGDVDIPEICYQSVESLCQYEKEGCKRLHSSEHYHWQIKESNNQWLNLRSNQSKCIECSYCSPDNTDITLPRLDPSTLEPSASGLLLILGRDLWKAEFKNLTLTNSSGTKVFQLRRLHTEIDWINRLEANTFIWYFKDQNQKWVEYGKADTLGKTDLVSSISSQNIEYAYLTTGVLVPVSFKNKKFTYELDFNTMTQTNLETKAKREVIRRPKTHIRDEKNNTKEDMFNLPTEWEPMQPEKETVRKVTLSPSSSEYQTVLGLLAGNSTKVIKIERVQNPFLWNAFQNKVKEMKTIYKGDMAKVNVQQLFHGTKPEVISNICAENFDWRLHGTSAGQAHGRGTYFSPNYNTSYGYCAADSHGLRYIFVASVAVGAITRGSSSMARPPVNGSTGLPYESTGNSTSNPSIIVKYDKQEYYPQYIITIS